MSLRLLAATFAVAPILFFTTAARADLSACGNIDVHAQASCKLVVKDCTASCTPISVAATCEARGRIDCTAKCNQPIVDVSCTGSCEADCNTRCTATPGTFDCNADCGAQCDTDCTAQCSGQAAGSEAAASCTASCRGSCSAHCSASCTGTAPTVDCSGRCHASCQGRCTAKVNSPCQVDCQNTYLHASCEGEVTGGCKVRCSDPKGALFCDGQYVDVGNNLQNCIDALKAELNITVDASGDASCTGNTCQAEGQVSVSGCSTSPDAGMSTFAPIAVALAATASALGRRKKKAA